jgi:leucyl/phenylalanyl-tRNA--protein transferase
MQKSISRMLLGMNAREMLAHHREGNWVFEEATCFISEYYKTRELIPITNHIPHGVRAAINRNNFLFSSNQHFEKVIDLCNARRKSIWIRDNLRSMLAELHEYGSAQSVEIYKDGGLVGGLIGINIGAMFVGLSVFSNYDGAGNAAFAALQRILYAQEFEVHDALQKSKISELFGGVSVTMGKYDILRRAALEIEPSFPKLDPQRFEMYFPTRPTLQDLKHHGRPFPR